MTRTKALIVVAALIGAVLIAAVVSRDGAGSAASNESHKASTGSTTARNSPQGGTGAEATQRTAPTAVSFARCSASTNRAQLKACLSEVGLKLARHDGIAVLERTVEQAGRDPRVQLECHGAMHVVGETLGKNAAKLNSGPPPAVPGIGNCGEGIAHGLLLGYLSEASVDALRSIDLKKMCPVPSIGPAGAAKTTDFQNCVHAIGHSAFRASKSVQRSVPVCEDIAQRAGSTPAAVHNYRLLCYNGVVMQSASDFPDRSLSCPDVSGAPPELRESCIAYLGFNAIVIADRDTRRVVARCEQIGTTFRERSMCAANIGQSSITEDVCNPFSPELRRVCVEKFRALKAAFMSGNTESIKAQRGGSVSAP